MTNSKWTFTLKILCALCYSLKLGALRYATLSILLQSSNGTQFFADFTSDDAYIPQIMSPFGMSKTPHLGKHALSLLIAVLAVMPVMAKKKSTTIYSYDQTGVVSFSSFADSSVTVNTESGSYSAYCTMSGSHADCGEGVGAGYFITLPNGSESAIGDVPVDPTSYEFGVGYEPSPQNPIMDIMNSSEDPRATHEIRFRFWTDRYGSSRICLPIDLSRAYPFKPLKHQTEACYIVVFGSPHSIATAQSASVQVDSSGNHPGLAEGVRANSEAAKASPAAAAAMADAGHILTPQEIAELVSKGEASRCAVVTTPAGAEVEIDGNKAGVSPLAFVLIKHGDTPRVITIKMNGYKNFEKAVIPDGKTIPIGLTLERQ